jgi:hypothetical protein
MMNERIFELAKQADLIQWDTLSSGARTPDHESVVKARKFAELIVRECADWIDRQDESRCPYGIDLLEHFGVEE